MTYISNNGWTYPHKPENSADFVWRWKYDFSKKAWELQWYDDAVRHWVHTDYFDKLEDIKEVVK